MTTTMRLRGRDGNSLAADVSGDGDAPLVLLLHGGGQTRHSWGATLEQLALSGYRAIGVDARGHGDSDWAADGDYSLDAYGGDIAAVVSALDASVAIVGASLGGLASLVAVAELATPCWALVLVDVATRVDAQGAARIGAFLRQHPDGFATPEEATDAVATYLPHRPRPRSGAGILKNLRLGEDGRYRWHWDPARLSHARAGSAWPAARLDAATARSADLAPMLLVYGGRSEIVNAHALDVFRRVAPTADLVEITSARHMVVGDDNDEFGTAVTTFLERAARRSRQAFLSGGGAPWATSS